ncbi:MAG: acetyl-CoA/propionyl-CoA carboxylase carboxyl transferase subunit, partial [Frankiaceae bacterium]|nr:acetyl-CoA/propionyl-CoA carboxylase carboxyl transferase subunit [Frankiaceae bacterium]
MTTVIDPGVTVGPELAVARPATSPHVRVGNLLDAGSFELANEHVAMIWGRGTALGTRVVVYATDPAIMGGALGAEGCQLICDAIAAARADGVPVIGVWHSGGARLQEGVWGLDGVGKVFAAMTHASGQVPQISVVLGPCAGGAAYGPALTDVVIMGPAARVFVTGPDVVRSVTGESVTAEMLGGPGPHGRRSGVVHIVSETEADALLRTRTVAALLGDQGSFAGDLAALDEVLPTLLPESKKRAYDVKPVVAAFLDEGSACELHAGWAPNLTTTLGRLAGRTVGVLANNPLRLGGCLDSASAEKGARFVRTCDAFGVPIVVLVDVPGYLPGVDQEWDGVVRRGAKLLHAFAEAVAPRVSVVTRKAYGGAYIAMNSKSLDATAVFAWAGAEVAVMGAEAAGDRLVLLGELLGERRAFFLGYGGEALAVQDADRGFSPHDRNLRPRPGEDRGRIEGLGV